MTETGKCYTAGLYCRLSKEDRLVDIESISIDTQKKKLTDFAREKGIGIGGLYIDDGLTGVFFDRPEFERMMNDAYSGKLNCVIVKDLSRLGRHDSESTRYYEEEFLQNGIRLIAIDDNVDTIRGYEKYVPFINTINAMYPRDISDKTRSAYRTKAQHGEFLGSKAPYGYLKSPNDKHKLIIEEETAAVVRHMFELAAQGWGRKRIAKILYEEKILTPAAYAKSKGTNRYDTFLQVYGNDCLWSDVTVGEMLVNEVYIGHCVNGKTRKLSFKSRKIVDVPPEEWVRVENTHEPIVSQEVWDEVQRHLKLRKRETKQKTYQIFGGLVKCADCKRALSFTSSKTSYNCRTYREKGKAFCTAHYISYDAMYAAVLSDIRLQTERLKSSEDEFYKAALKCNEAHMKKDTKKWQDQLKRVNKRIDELDFIIKKTHENNILGKISDERFAILNADYEREQTELKKQAGDLKNSIEQYKTIESDAKNFTALVRKYVGIEELTMEILNELVDHIEVGEKYVDEDGEKTQDIIIFYAFCGAVA